MPVNDTKRYHIGPPTQTTHSATSTLYCGHLCMISASTPSQLATLEDSKRLYHKSFARRCQGALTVRKAGRRMAEASLTVPYTELEQGIERLLQLPAPHYVVFLADPDPTTGVSWCPDCVRCGPAVKQFMADRKASLLEVLVGQRAVWKDQQHPLRHHPQIKLSGVPDLMRWSSDGPIAKMGSTLEKASSPPEAVAVVAKFFIDAQ